MMALNRQHTPSTASHPAHCLSWLWFLACVMVFQEGFCVDLLVEDTVIVELKSVEKLAPVHSKQVLTYLRLMNLHIGLLINFGAPTLKEGLRRIAN